MREQNHKFLDEILKLNWNFYQNIDFELGKKQAKNKLDKDLKALKEAARQSATMVQTLRKGDGLRNSGFTSKSM